MSTDPTAIPNELLATMLHHSLWTKADVEWRTQGRDRLLEGLQLLHSEPAVVEELLQVLDLASRRIEHVTHALVGSLRDLPLRVHARYSRAEMLAGVGWTSVDKSVSGQNAGVHFVAAHKVDVFDVTWQKSEREYSPSTLYRDYAVSRDLLNWESQNSGHLAAESIQRYINHEAAGTSVLFFARESQNWEFASRRPYLFLGSAKYVSHSGERPVTFRWRLDQPMPADFFTSSEVLAG